MFDLSDTQAYWLTLTNIGLGIVTISFIVYIVLAILRDLWQHILHPDECRGPDAFRKAS